MPPRPDDTRPDDDARDGTDAPAAAGSLATRPYPPPGDDFTGDALLDYAADQWAWLVRPGEVREVRLIDVPNGDYPARTFCGYFTGDRLRDLAVALAKGPRGAAGTYVSLNPTLPDLVARADHRLAPAKRGGATNDAQIVARRWLLVDVDPVRPAGISATDAEKAEASAVIAAVRAHLAGLGWPAGLLADSGNGYHAFYRVDLTADDEGRLVERVLKALAARFDTPAATVDRAVFNASRIVKLPMTWARKGDSTPERPHRRATLLEVPDVASPDDVGVVTRELLEALAAECPPPTAATRTAAGTGSVTAPGAGPSAGEFASRLDVGRWLADTGVGFHLKDRPDARGRAVYVLAACPFNPEHADPDACVMQSPDGRLSAKCLHSSCAGRGWQEFKAAIGRPRGRHYDPPLGPTPSRKSKPAPAGGPPGDDDDHPGGDGPPDDEGHDGPPAAPAPRSVLIDPNSRPVRESLADLTAILAATGLFYRRAGQLVELTPGTVRPVLTPAHLAGALNAHAECRVATARADQYRPLPRAYAETWLNNPAATGPLPEITLYTRNPVFAPDDRLLPPGHDPATGIYYDGPAVAPVAGTLHLDALLADFCFRSPADRANYLGLLVTAVLMPRFVGSKPLALFHGNQPGLGKTVLAQVLAILRDGRPTRTLSYNPNDEEFEKALGAKVKAGLTTIVVDNAKADGRRGGGGIDSACLERCVTDEVLSFRLLGASEEIRAENSHLFCVTANAPVVSRDLLTRSLVVRLHHDGDPARRAFACDDPEGYALEHRHELLGELVGMVAAWLAAGKPLDAAAKSRFNKRGWGPTVGGVLLANGVVGFLADAAAVGDELDPERAEFARLVAALAEEVGRDWTAAEVLALADRRTIVVADGEGPSRAVRFGVAAARFLGEPFDLGGGLTGTLRRVRGRAGQAYRVEVAASGAAANGPAGDPASG